MNMAWRKTEAHPPGVEPIDGADALATILQPNCAAAIWERPTPPTLRTWLDGLAPDALPRGRIILRPEEVAHRVQQMCDAAGLPQSAERALLCDDITDLAHRFAAIMPVDFLRLRLDVVSGNACRKFHIDAVTARLICTYRGTGTQYGAAKVGAEPEDIRTAGTGDVIVLRGTLWPVSEERALLHRSPPIEGTGETRLMLVLDPVFDPEVEA